MIWVIECTFRFPIIIGHVVIFFFFWVWGFVICLQIHEEARKFSYQTGVKVVVAYGGAPINQQVSVSDLNVFYLLLCWAIVPFLFKEKSNYFSWS